MGASEARLGRQDGVAAIQRTTFALAGKVAERPDFTKQLHTVIEAYVRGRIEMLPNAKRVYALQAYTVELRAKGWFYWPTYRDKDQAKGHTAPKRPCRS
jgi:hypothetical protein